MKSGLHNEVNVGFKLLPNNGPHVCSANASKLTEKCFLDLRNILKSGKY